LTVSWAGSRNMKSGGTRPAVASDRLIQLLCLDAVERRQIRVEHHALTADHVDPRFDPRGDRLRWHGDDIGLPLLG